MKYLARRGTSDWMVWDREAKRPARHRNANLVRLSRTEAAKLAAQLNGIGTFKPDDDRVEMTAAELLHTIHFRLASAHLVPPRGIDLLIKVESDRWHAVCYSPDPVRDVAYVTRVRSIADDLVTRVKVKLD